MDLLNKIKKLLSGRSKAVYLSLGIALGLLLFLAPKIILGLLAFMSLGVKSQQEQIKEIDDQRQKHNQAVSEAESVAESKEEEAVSVAEKKAKDWLDGDF